MTAIARPLTRRDTWGALHYLACVGAFMLLVQAFTWTRWLIAGPYSITQYRDVGSLSWYAARFYEGLAVALALACIVYVWRKCRRERRLVFDAKLVIAGASLFWLDSLTDFIAPLWLYSSQWMNFNNPLGFAPFVINPVLKDLPFPVFFHFFNYIAALFCAALLVCWVIRKVRERWPHLSTAKLLGIVVLIGIGFDLLYETPFFLLGLWAFPGTPDELALFGDTGHKFPIWEYLPAGFAFATFGALRYFKDDKGLELTERGLERLPAAARAWVSTLALIGIVHMVWVIACSIQMLAGFYADPWKPLPRHLVNGLCDAPLIEGGRAQSRYGACPQQGVPLPVRWLPEDAAARQASKP